MNLHTSRNDRLSSESETGSWFQFSSPLRYILFLVVMVVLIVGVWMLIFSSNPTCDKINLPLIHSDEPSFKIKAEDQSVPGISHQDKLVYGRIREDETQPVVEHILPAPEDPIVLMNEETPPLKMVEQYAPQDGIFEEDVEVTKSEPSGSSSSTLSIADLIEVPPQNESFASVSKKEERGNIFIQLGSLKSQDAAQEEWERLSKRHKDLLGNYKPFIQKVDLGSSQGVYHRLRAGPLENIETAETICTSLKQKKVECLVIH